MRDYQQNRGTHLIDIILSLNCNLLVYYYER